MILTGILSACLVCALFFLWGWHRFHRRQPVVRPKCGCDACTGKAQQAQAQLPRFTLSPEQIAQMQAGITLVAAGVIPAGAFSLDYVSSRGVGQVAIVVMDSAAYAQVVEPALRARIAPEGR